MSDQATPLYLTPPELAALLRVSLKTLYRLIERDPSLPVTRLTTGTLRFRRESVAAWLADQEQGRRITHQVRQGSRKPVEWAPARRSGSACAEG